MRKDLINLKYFNKFPNIGDILSVEICKYYFSDNITHFSSDETNLPNLLLIGSILEWVDSCSLVCGSGFIKKDSKLRSEPKLITCVRGQLSNQILKKQGILDINRFGDPGLLISNLYASNIKPKYSIGLIPHYVDKKIASVNKSYNDEEVSIIDVFLSPKEFSMKVQECEVILSSSLHGLIVAHSFGIPAHWVEFSNNVIGDGFKFYDYYSGLGVPIEKVKKSYLMPNTNLYEIKKMASTEKISDSIDMLNESIYETRKALME